MGTDIYLIKYERVSNSKPNRLIDKNWIKKYTFNDAIELVNIYLDNINRNEDSTFIIDIEQHDVFDLDKEEHLCKITTVKMGKSIKSIIKMIAKPPLSNKIKKSIKLPKQF